MISAIADGFRSQMVVVLILKPQMTDMSLPSQKFLDSLNNQLVAPLQSIAECIIEGWLFDVDVEGQHFPRDVWASQLASLHFVVYHTHRLVDNRFIRHGVFHKIVLNEIPNARPLGEEHQFLLLRIGKQHVTNHVVPVVVPRSQLFHLLTCTFP